MMKYLLPVVATVLSLAAYADEVNPDDRMVSNGPMVPIAVSVAVVALGANRPPQVLLLPQLLPLRPKTPAKKSSIYLSRTPTTPKL